MKEWSLMPVEVYGFGMGLVVGVGIMFVLGAVLLLVIRAVTNAAWYKNWEELDQFKGEEGRLPRHGEYAESPEEQSIHDWLEKQRSAISKGKLSAERQALIESIVGVTSEVLSTDAAWDARCAELEEFKEVEGRLPRQGKGVSPEERSLNNWFARQRAAVREGKLSPEQQALIERLTS